MLAAAWLPQLGKYVPGKVFTVAGLVWVLRRFGVPVSFGVTVALVMTGIFVLVGVVLSIPLMLQEPLATKVPLGGLWCAVLLLAGLLCLHPRILGTVANFVLRLLRRPSIIVPPHMKSYGMLVLNCLAQWVLIGLSLFFMLKSFSDAPMGLGTLWLVIASSALATWVGIVVFFMPAGLVVREGVLMWILGAAPALSHVQVLGPILGTRVIQTILELIMGVAAFMILRSRKTRELEVG
jgi:hypothetical protein